MAREGEGRVLGTLGSFHNNLLVPLKLPSLAGDGDRAL